MAQIDIYLNRLISQNKLSYQDDLLELYAFVQNKNLRTLLASYHTQLNRLFAILNEGIQVEYDEDGNRLYKGGYFHAQDSRDLLSVMDAVEQLRKKCRSTEYAFNICATYSDAIRRCRRFVVKMNGSTIPEEMLPIEIIDLSPVFQLVESISISQNKQILSSSLKLIGEGSYAQVFSYTDPIYSIPIILKRARPNLDNKELTRFKQEFETLKKLHSPYIIEAYTYEDAKNEYTMEHMDETIYKYIQRKNGQLTLIERKKIIAQICKGISYIHSKNLLHRDISLTNILIKHYDDVDVVKISDFGLVKLPESNLTSLQSEVKGSLNDPDLVNVGFGNYEIRHETFALTRLFYYILTGRSTPEKQEHGAAKDFWCKGTSPNKADRFSTVDEAWETIKHITDENK